MIEMSNKTIFTMLFVVVVAYVVRYYTTVESSFEYNELDYEYRMKYSKDDHTNKLDGLKFYYINLKRSVDRNENILRQFNEYGVTNYTRIDAYDKPGPFKFQWIMSEKEKACTSSHLKAIRQFYDDGFEYGIIVEDDVNFDYVPHQKIRLIDLIHYRDFDIIQLAYSGFQYRVKEKLMHPRLLSKNHLWGTVAYIISRLGAGKVLSYKGSFGASDWTIYSISNTLTLNRPYFTYYYTKDFDTNIQDNIETAETSKMLTDKYYNITSI